MVDADYPVVSKHFSFLFLKKHKPRRHMQAEWLSNCWIVSVLAVSNVSVLKVLFVFILILNAGAFSLLTIQRAVALANALKTRCWESKGF